ncbi:MAG TPA: DinB family protein [Terriglobales bacterium]|nr:DinB family protein [Terriglobales bacterium]
MNSNIASHYLDEILRSLRGHKRLADEAIAQLSDEQFFAAPSADANSVAIIAKHMAGNMRSRFTNFLISDGEKPDRNRDQEFVMQGAETREEVLRAWERHWQLVFDTVGALQPEDLERTVTIRDQPHSVLQALQRAAAHLAYHTGQIVFLAKHWRGAEWKSLSIPKGQSEQVNAAMREKYRKAK